MKVNKLARLALVGLLVSSILGCGTYAARIENRNYASAADYYSGTITDFEILTFDSDLASVLCYITIVCPFVVLASIPVDLAVDTLNIPGDYARADRKEEMTHAQAGVEPNHGCIKFDFSKSDSIRFFTRPVWYWVTYKNGTDKAIRLNVDNVTLVDGSVMAYIPTFKGYLPVSIWLGHGGGYNSLDVEFSFSNAAPLSIDDDSKLRDGLYSNNSPFAFYESGHGARSKESIVTITPFINHPNVWFSIGERWAARARTH